MASRVLAFVLVTCAASHDARAQDVDPGERPVVVTPGEEALLRSRNRATLHPSNPLKIGGREQDGNDMRSRTSALQRGDTTTRGVEGDEAYARAVAMVDKRSRFQTPPARAAANTTAADAAVVALASDAAGRADSGASTTEPKKKSNLPWVLGGFATASVLLLGWLTLRHRI